MDEATEQPIFKVTSLSKSPKSNKKRVWKSLKQILQIERSLKWPEDAVTCKYLYFKIKKTSTSRNFYLFPPLDSSLNPPPSFRPAKKYSDISGLIAPYTDPQTKLHYHNAEEFQTIRTMPSDLVAGYLALRGASSIVG